MIVPKFKRIYDWEKKDETNSIVDDNHIISGEERLDVIENK